MICMSCDISIANIKLKWNIIRLRGQMMITDVAEDMIIQ